MLAAPLLAATTAAAEQAYITDKVSIDVHSLQNEEGLVVTSLMSGTPVEILITDGKYTQIKTPDNKTGWLNSKFLSSEKPAAEEYVQLLAKYKAATEELERAQVNLTKLPEVERVARNAGAAQDELKKRKSQIQTLERNLKTRDKQLADAQQAVAELKRLITGGTLRATPPGAA